MAQHLFQVQLRDGVIPQHPFCFKKSEINAQNNNFCNVIRVKNKSDLLSADLKNEDAKSIDLKALLKKNIFLHTPFKLIGSELLRDTNNNSIKDPLKEKEIASEGSTGLLGLGTKVVDTVQNGDLDENGQPITQAVSGRPDDEIDIILSKSVLGPTGSVNRYIFCAQEFLDATRRASIGLDASIPQKLTTLVPLFATDGTALVDDFGNQLVAETQIALVETIQSINSTLLNVTKRERTATSTGHIKVKEIFPTVSEVSTTLLGIPRAETQLSLFSDVSTTGFDEQNWEVFKALEEGRLTNAAWENRQTKLSQRYNAKLVENTLEQALELTAFPVPYTYPYDAKSQHYKADLYLKFVRWVLLGNYMYKYYEGISDAAKDDFLDPALATVIEVDVARNSDISVERGDVLKFPSFESQEVNFPAYEKGRDAAYRAIDIWTETFTQLINGTYKNATMTSVFELVYRASTFQEITNLLSAKDDDGEFIFTNIVKKIKPSGVDGSKSLLRQGVSNFYVPGYPWPEDDKGEEIILQTKETYRYQPGRISGFTFGTKADIVSSDGGTQVEWGVENDTDAYLFRLSGSALSIVRKSTVPLSSQFLIDENLVGRQKTLSGEKNPFTGVIKPDFYELEIGQREWNHDTLDGNGPSGFSVTPENVTMWKIEFSWYGAIGARFYAYIPVENGEARWVLVHTIVIENKLIKACLEDPFFRMKYSFRLRNRENSQKPQFIYKYGSSVYIDGGDEGTKRQFSYTGEKKTSVNDTYVPLLGLKAKTFISNRQGDSRLNRKISYPELLNVNATEFTQFEMLECEACPGFGFTYDDGVVAQQPQSATNPKKINFHIHTLSGGAFGEGGTQYIRLSDYTDFDTLHQESPDPFENVGFTPDDEDAQVLVPGMAKRYIDYGQTLKDFIAADGTANEEEFVFEDTDLRGPVGLVDDSTKTIDSSTTSQSFNIDSSVLNAFDIPTGSVVQVKINFNNTGAEYDEFDVYLESDTEITSDKVAHADTADGEYTFRLTPTKEGSTKITINALSGLGGLHNSPPDVEPTEVNITGIRISEFKMSRIRQRGLNSAEDFTGAGLLKDGINETPKRTENKFLAGDALMRIGTVDSDGGGDGITFEFEGGTTALAPRVREIVQYLKGESVFDADSPGGTNFTLSTLSSTEALRNVFTIDSNVVYINRTFFDGDYSDAEDSPFDTPPTRVPVKEYTWFIGNKATLSPINKIFASSDVLIESEDAEIRFLNPTANHNFSFSSAGEIINPVRTSGQRTNNTANFITGKQSAEFRIAFTNINPNNNKTPREKDLLFAEWDRPTVNIDAIGKAENISGEGDTFGGLNNIVDTFQLDYRIKRIPHDMPRQNGGLCSKVKIGAAGREDFLINIGYFATKDDFENSAQFNSFTVENYAFSIFDDLGDRLLVVSSSTFLDRVFDRNNNLERKIIFNGGELGINSTASGINFASEPIYFKYIDDNNIEQEACVIQLDSDGSSINPTDEITLSAVKLEYTYASSGSVFVTKEKIFGFDPFPLYPLFFTRYGARINNINFKNGNVVTSPNFTFYGDDIDVISPLAASDPGYIAPGNAAEKNSENFEETDKLSSLLVDKNANKRLRKIFTPGDTGFGQSFKDGALAGKLGNIGESTRVKRLTTLYAGGGDVSFDTQKINLTDIFKEDRFKIQPDFRDAKAIFVVGKQPNEDTPPYGTFQASVNTSEV